MREQPQIFQMRLKEEDAELFEELVRLYPRLTKTDLVRFALEYLQARKPTFQIKPQTQEAA